MLSAVGPRLPTSTSQLLLGAQFVYLKDSFTPSPDELLGVPNDAFGRDGTAGQKELVLSYALTPAWG